RLRALALRAGRAAPRSSGLGAPRASRLRPRPTSVDAGRRAGVVSRSKTTEGEALNRRVLASVAGALLLLLAVLTASATASDGIQVAGQSADNQQVAGAASGATQVQPSNTNISVRVLSPGNDGSVSQ